MALYARAMDLKLSKPMPAHALTPEAEEARLMMRSYGYARHVERIIVSLVTKHGHRRIRYHDAPPPAAYRRVKALAEAHGFTVTEYRSPTGHALQGRRGDLGFRAFWQWGRTTGATWHERTARWMLVDDPRPVKMNERDHVGLKGYRTTGMGRTRLKLLATPDGLPLKLTILEQRIASS